MSTIEKLHDEMMCLYSDLKRLIRNEDKHLYERWKAGGFIIDEDIMSMYPNLTKVVETLSSREDEEEYEEEECP